MCLSPYKVRINGMNLRLSRVDEWVGAYTYAHNAVGKDES